MAGVNVRVDADFAPIREYLGMVEDMGSNAANLFDEIGAALVSSTQARFATSTAPDGGAWKPVKRGGRPLVDQGILVGSITHAAGAKQVEVGTNLVYGAIHQFGGRAGRGHSVNIDARPYLGLSTEDEDEVVGILRDFVEGFA